MFQMKTKLLGIATAIGLLAAPFAASASSTFVLDSGTLDTIQLFDISGNQVASPCPLGSANNCLVNAPLAIDQASITLDFNTMQVMDLNLLVSSTGQLNLGGINGYSHIDFTGTSYQSGTSSSFTLAGGTQYNFQPVPGIVSVDNLDMYMMGNTSGTPDASLPYANTATPGGNFIMGPNGMTIRLTGVDIGVFVDPLTGLDPVVAKADFTFTATNPIPEPTAALLFSVGFVVAAGATRRKK
jgi:hypothetical protein